MKVRQAVLPGAWLGLLGGGQLGRMFCMAAQSMGYRVCVLDLDPNSPAAAVADAALTADYLNEAALDQLAARCAAITTEFENVPAQALERLAQRVPVRPGAAAVAIAQDRIAEKAFLERCGIALAPYRVLRTEADVLALDQAVLPGILKVARLGYDGKGQRPVTDAAEALAAFREWGEVPCVLERRLALEQEVSVLVARNASGERCVWPLSENVHRHGILAVSRVPARVPPALAERAQALSLAVAEGLEYEGVLCVEWFVLPGGELRANEIAPRPHNSGHYTLDASVTSQFEQQVRVLAGWPLGATRALSPSVMLNLLGDLWFQSGVRTEPDWSVVLRHPGAKLHLYGKAEPKPGRKMGHITIVEPSLAQCQDTLAQVAAALRVAPEAWSEQGRA